MRQRSHPLNMPSHPTQLERSQSRTELAVTARGGLCCTGIAPVASKRGFAAQSQVTQTKGDIKVAATPFEVIASIEDRWKRFGATLLHLEGQSPDATISQRCSQQRSGEDLTVSGNAQRLQEARKCQCPSPEQPSVMPSAHKTPRGSLPWAARPSHAGIQLLCMSHCWSCIDFNVLSNVYLLLNMCFKGFSGGVQVEGCFEEGKL